MFTIGSCFSDVIGGRLAAHKVATQVNPFGTVFNPLAAAKLLRAAAGEDVDWQQHLVEARGRWQSYDLHASFGADSPAELGQRIEQTVREATDFLRTADVVVWTLGTAFSYRLRDTGELVNNLHKLPSERFEKELLSAEEIVTAVAETHALLRRLNPKIRLVLTVSPVRHLRDTLPLNAVSKSVLRVACHYLAELLPATTYFPAYELLLDDLRDYRFYGADMLHPSEVAEDYIWEKFTGAYFDESFRDFVFEWDAIQRSLAHRPLHEGAPEHRHFLEQTEARLQRLADVVNVRQELRELHKRIVALPAPKPVALPEEDDEERIDIGEGSAPVLSPAPRRPEPPAVAPVEAAPLAQETPEEAVVDLDEPADDEFDEENSYFAMVAGASLDESTAEETDDVEATEHSEEAVDGALPSKRRKRKRGGRKHKRGNRPAEGALAVGEDAGDATAVPAGAETPQPLAALDSAPAAAALAEAPAPEQPLAAELPQPEEAAEPRSSRSRRGRGRKTAAAVAEAALPEVAVPPLTDSVPADSAPAAPSGSPEQPTVAPEPASAAPTPLVESEAGPTAADEPAAPPKRAASKRKPARTPVPPRPRPNRQATAALAAPAPAPEPVALPTAPQETVPTPEVAPAPRRRAAPRRQAAPAAAPAAPPAAPAVAAEAAAPARKTRRKPAASGAEPAPAAPADSAPAAPKRRTRPPRRKPDASEPS